MSMINIDELHKQQNEKKNRKKKIFEDILKKCHAKIKNTAKTEQVCFCFFKVPVYIYGVPLYDMKSCILYIVTALSKNGFDLKYHHPNLIYISWLGKTNKSIEAPKKNENKFINNYRSIDNYKPSGNFISTNSNKSNIFNSHSRQLLK